MPDHRHSEHDPLRSGQLVHSDLERDDAVLRSSVDMLGEPIRHFGLLQAADMFLEKEVMSILFYCIPAFLSLIGFILIGIKQAKEDIVKYHGVTNGTNLLIVMGVLVSALPFINIAMVLMMLMHIFDKNKSSIAVWLDKPTIRKKK